MILSREYLQASAGPALLVLVLVLQTQQTSTLPRTIKIGGLFDSGDLRQEVAFQYAVGRVNHHRSSFRHLQSRLKPIVKHIKPHDSFQASKRVCHMMRSGVAAIFGPQSRQTSAHVQSICDAMEVPHVETRWDYRLVRDDYSVNLYPHPKSLSQAYLDLVHLFGWSSFCILYEDNDGLVRLQNLLNLPQPFKIRVRQLPVGHDFREVLRSIKRTGEMNILLDCRTEIITEVLMQAMQIGMITPYNNYIITSLDTHRLNLEEFSYGGSNITALRLLDDTQPLVAQIMREMTSSMSTVVNTDQEYPLRMGTETALMYDAVHVFMMAMQALDNSTEVQIKSLACDEGDAWAHGNSLINYMKMVNHSGLTGYIEFDALGFRTKFKLDIVELGRQGFIRVGSWDKVTGANYTRAFEEIHYQEATGGIENRTLLVSFAVNPPYIMRKKSSAKLSGNDRYEGFCISLLEEVSKKLHFNYKLIHVEGDKYGNKNATTGEFNGMIRELIDKKVDMAITDLTINAERAEVVDFTMPFMNLGISIIYKKPTPMAPSLFSFLSPLSAEVWVYMMAAYVGVSVFLYILARFSPYEWQNPHPCESDPDSLENQFTMLNCMWFSIGSLMQQGCDFLPQAVSTRMVAGMWWFFTLIMISSYTANLAAFLTVERLESPISSAEDLANQKKIKYGAYIGGSTAAFFRDSKIDVYQKMYKYMVNNPDSWAPSNSAGFARAIDKNENYAFLAESTSIEYIIERQCHLTQVGGLLDSKSYGIALQRGSPYKDALDVAILNLQETGRIFQLKEIWWKQRHGGGKCKEEEGGSASELNLENVGGVFVVLMGGMALALSVAILEFLWECKEIAQDDNLPFMEVLRQELRFVMKCKGSTKPVRKKCSDDADSKEDESENDGIIYSGSDVYAYGVKHPFT